MYTLFQTFLDFGIVRNTFPYDINDTVSALAFPPKFIFSLQNLNMESTLKANNGRHVKALEIFTHAIHYLHARALEVIQERTGDEHFNSADIQWVLTVPAIWKPAAKQFMREAAYQVVKQH